MMLSVVLLLVALAALAVAVILYRMAGVPVKRRRFNGVLTAIAAAVALFVAAGSVGWALAIPITMLLISALLITYAWAWKFDSFVGAKADRLFAGNADLENKMASNPLLKHFVKRPPR